MCRHHLVVLSLLLAAIAAAGCSSPDPFNECMLRCLDARTPYPQGACLDLCEHGAVGGEEGE